MVGNSDKGVSSTEHFSHPSWLLKSNREELTGEALNAIEVIVHVRSEFGVSEERVTLPESSSVLDALEATAKCSLALFLRSGSSLPELSRLRVYDLHSATALSSLSARITVADARLEIGSVWLVDSEELVE